MRFPLPELIDGKLQLPVVKTADGPPAPASGPAPDLWHHSTATPPAAAPSLWGRPPAASSAPAPSLWHRPGEAPPTVMGALQHAAPGLARDTAVGSAVEMGMQRAIPAAASRYGLESAGVQAFRTGVPSVQGAARAIPSLARGTPLLSAGGMGLRLASGARAAGLWATPVNIGTDLLDAAGIHSVDGSKPFNAWQRPRLNMNGDVMRDAAGNPQWDVGFNPSGFGFNMREFDHGTTPDGTALGTTSTGNFGSYGLSSARAFFNPLKSTTVLGRQLWEAPSQTMGTARHYAQQGWRPGAQFQRGGQYFEQEAQRYRNEDRYHSTYNPTGTNNRPWAGQRWWNSLWN